MSSSCSSHSRLDQSVHVDAKVNYLVLVLFICFVYYLYVLFIETVC